MQNKLRPDWHKTADYYSEKYNYALKEILRLLIILMFLIALEAVFFISLSSALRTTLDTPQVTFRGNTGEEVNYYLGITNKNPFPLNISITPPQETLIKFEENRSLNFILISNESKRINYMIFLDKGGNYTKSFSVLYQGNGSSFTLSQNMIFIVNGSDINLTKPSLIDSKNNSIKSNKINKNDKNIFLLFALVLVMIILLLFVLREVAKKDNPNIERREE